jgi:deoxyribonuclease V
VKACVDVHYRRNGTARVALVAFENWQDAASSRELVFETTVAADYVPGEFYRRELDPILRVLEQFLQSLEVVLVDGYCELSPDGKFGLGAHLLRATDLVDAVVGVAKTRYSTATHAIEVYRGKSVRPLLVTACGADPQWAAEKIAEMHGEHRIPTLIKLADSLSKGA